LTRLLFISRVALICNVCMLIAWLMRYAEPLQNVAIQSTIIIAGFLLAVVFNLMSAAWVLVLLLQGRRDMISPAWLFIINFLCFAFQIYLFIK
jgi:hypothetical protein